MAETVLELRGLCKEYPAFRLKDVPGDWQNIVVILNANRKSVDVAVPGGNYTVVGQEGRISEEGLGTVSGPTVSVAPQSALIIHN